jgi:hypothetical protein
MNVITVKTKYYNRTKILIQKYINRADFDNIPLEDGSLIANDNHLNDDICFFCLENIDTDSKIKIFECCKKIIHFSCYQEFIKLSNNKNCPNCRQPSSEIKIIHKKPIMCSFYDNNDYDNNYFKRDKSCKNPLFCDNSNNITVRHTLFINKYNIRHNEHYISRHTNNFSYIEIINIICEFSIHNFEKLDDNIFYQLKKSITNLKLIALNASFFTSFKKFIIKISNLLNFNKTNELIKYIDDFIEIPLKLLSNSSKKDFPQNLKKFLMSKQTFFWFHLINIEQKKTIYNKLFAHIIGEKFRNIIISNDLCYSIHQINLYLYKH